MNPSVDDLLQYAQINGIVYGVKPNPDSSVPSRAYAIHAPFTLQPYRYPRDAFEKAQSLAIPFNNLYKRISLRPDWLLNKLEVTGQSDEFTGQLLSILKAVTEEGVSQKAILGIFRSDYMLHQVAGDSRNLLQVEINTISSSFGCLSTKIADMFSYFAATSSATTGNEMKPPDNTALHSVVGGLAAAHREYLRQRSLSDAAESGAVDVKSVVVAMVVQKTERNISDQRNIEYELWRQHGIVCRRFTLDDIFTRGRLTGQKNIFTIDEQEVSVTYFRAGYTPDDYLTADNWTARLLVERSFSIKCPNISLHIAGCKKIQQELALPGALEQFVDSESEAATLRDVFAGLYSLDVCESSTSPTDSRPPILAEAVASPGRFVMKPQREGGGNNIYNEDIRTALASMTSDELSAFILMERIFPPSQPARMIREGRVVEDECICELGCFGVLLSVPGGSGSELQDAVNSYGGYLLRVKPTMTDEGGVAAGYAVLSAPLLV